MSNDTNRVNRTSCVDEIFFDDLSFFRPLLNDKPYFSCSIVTRGNEMLYFFFVHFQFGAYEFGI